MRNNDDFIPEEIDARNQPIVQALRDVCHTSPEDAQSLAKVEERLLATLQQRHSLPAFTTATGSQHTMGERAAANRYKEKAWQRRLSIVAAVAVVVLLVGSLSVIVTFVHRNGGGTPQQTPAATTSPTVTHLPNTVFFQSFHMIDARTGWAASDFNGIYRTTDGGTHWKNVTPHGVSLGPEAFLSATDAWVLTADENGHMSVARTVDGGQTWQDIHLNYPPVTDSTLSLHIAALNAQDWWLYSRSYILRTTDGGKTWQTLLTPQASNAPLLYIRWMTLKDPLNGWALGASNKDPSEVIFVTHDGGKTWQDQTNAFSPQLRQGQPEPLRFLDVTDGILPAGMQVGQSQSTAFYTTHDGGATWSMTAQLQGTAVGGTPQVLDTDFLDMNHWFVVDIQLGHAFNTVVHVTSDGGSNWTTIHPQSDYNNVYDLDFLTSQVGWALSDASPQIPPGLLDSYGVLIKTVDGGKSWRPVYVPRPQ